MLHIVSYTESSYNVSDVEGQLLAVYEPSIIKDLLTDLYENRGFHPAQIIALNDKVGYRYLSRYIAQHIALHSWYEYQYLSRYITRHIALQTRYNNSVQIDISHGILHCTQDILIEIEIYSI